MKRTRHLLLTAALLVSTFSLTAGSITSVSELSNTKLYHVSQPNHSEGATAWAVQAGGSVLKSNNDLGIAPDNNDTCQQFAFLSNDGGVTRFLYHPTEEKFICRDGSLSTVPADPVYLKEGAYDNTFVAYFDDSHYINVGGSQQMVIDSWNTLDGGNSCAITAVGEFEPSAVIGSIPVTAQLDGIWYRLLLESRQASVVSNPDGATKYTGDISVSSAVTFDGLMCSVTSIGERAFSGCSNLTAITLPEGVTSIGVDAFSGCSGLTSIVVAEGNTVYDSREDCNAIIVTGTNALVLGCSTTVIPEGVTSIGRYAFYGCDGLTSITLPESLESIGENAFEDCSGLTSINIPVSVTSIGRDAFYKCSSLVSVVIPVNVTCIEWGAFSCCNSLTSITIPESVTSIGNYAFFRCCGLASITIPESVTSIGDYAFFGCSGLASITIPESVTSIGSSAFCDCSGLASITIPESMTSIGSSAFCDCSGLTSITIPESVTSIGDDAFQNTAWYENQSEGVVYAGKVLYRYKGTMPENTSIEIKEGTKGIAGRAFYDCDGLASITIPESVTSIAGYAFYGCSLTEVQISSIEAWCNIDFGGSYANPLLFAENFCLDGEPIVELTIPNSVTAVKDYAFDGYDTLTSVTLPEGIMSIGASAFSRCSSLTSITCEAETPPTIGSSLTFSEVDKSISVYVPSSSVEAYRAAEYWNEFTNIQPMVAFGTCGDNLTWRLTDAGELIIEGTGTMNDYGTVTELSWNELLSSITKVTIEEGVTSIGSRAFQDCSNLTSIAIPASVTSIGGSAFSGCSSLTSIAIPESVMSIGGSAFYNCNLTDVHISSIESWCNIDFGGVYSNPIVHTENLYLNGELVTELTIPNSVTAIKDYAFDSYPSLTAITLPEGVTSIGKSAFSHCSSLASITIPESVTSIGDYAFSGCSGLTSITIPESVTSVGVGAFDRCGRLTNVHISSIEAWCNIDFEGNFSNPIVHKENLYLNGNLVTELTIPNSVTAIKDYAFDSYPSLTSITLPESITSIGKAAFYYCRSLTSITIPEGVRSIGDKAFSYCNSLTSVVSLSAVAPEMGTDVFEDIASDATLTIPPGSTSSYEEAGWTSYFASVVEMAGGSDGNITWMLTPDGELIIRGTGAMSDYEDFTDVPWNEHRSSITKVTIKEGVTSIGNYAFRGCSNPTSITIPAGVTSVGVGAFLDCSSLTSITIPESVTSIGVWAFSDCIDLISIVVEEGNAIYDSREGCNAIIETSSNTLVSGCSTTIIPNTVTSIRSYAFKGCSNLASITIPEGVTSIGGGAFSGCSNLTSIILPEGVTSIGGSAFFGCSSLTSITIPEGVTSIGGSAFSGCSSLTSITIPESVTSIGVWAFSDCIDLISIVVEESNAIYDSREGCNAIIETSSNTLVSGCSTTIIPNTVTSIGFGAFDGCMRLTSINIPGSVTSIGSYAFKDCVCLTSINLPESVTSIGGNAFSACSSLTSITIPEGVTSIGDDAFRDCRSLTSIIIPVGVTSIEDATFYDCSSLTSITIPESVTSIGLWAFLGCSSLTSITIETLTPPTIETTTFGNVDRSIPVYVPASSVSAYQSAEYWSEFTNIQTIPEVITINQYGSATYCSEYALDFSEMEGLKAYAATGYNTKIGVVTLTRVMTSQPGMGLFLKGEPGEYIVPTLENTDDNSLNMLVGTVERTAINSTSDDGRYRNYRYTIKSGDQEPLFYVVEDGYTLGKGKAYLQIPVVWLPAETKAIGLRFDDGATTDIEDVGSTDNGEQATDIYDFMGRKVTNPQKGMMYIVNGKKTIMN